MAITTQGKETGEKTRHASGHVCSQYQTAVTDEFVLLGNRSFAIEK